MRSLRIAAVGAFAALVVAACSSNDNNGSTSNNTSPPAPPAATSDSGGGAPTTSSGGSSGDSSSAAITIQNFQFGQPLQVKPGTTITVTNKDSAAHNVVADDGSFKTELLDQNQSATFTAPTKPGTYTFSCTVHTNMKGIGTLVVAG